jgi:hypothetical protein
MIHLLTLKQFNNELPSNGAGWNTPFNDNDKDKDKHLCIGNNFSTMMDTFGYWFMFQGTA